MMTQIIKDEIDDTEFARQLINIKTFTSFPKQKNKSWKHLTFPITPCLESLDDAINTYIQKI